MIILCFFIILNLNENHIVQSLKECVHNQDIEEYVQTGRLPHFVKPRKYFISLDFDQSLTSYSAVVDIDITVNKTTNLIILHSDGFDMTNIEIQDVETQKSKGKYEIKNLCFAPSTQFLVIRIKESLVIYQNFTLHFTLNRNISKLLKGIYQSYYKTKDNRKIKVVSTQFEDINARLAFPCFDEPRFKAEFNLEITHPKTHIALSNTEVNSKIIVDDKLKVKFEETPKMSPYLLAFVIHDYSVISTTTSGGIKISVWLPSDLIDQGAFALEIAPKAIHIYETVLNVKYKLKKLDLIGIPGFDIHAMENWGLVTFSMTALLVDEKFTSIKDKIAVGYTIAHEIAHQWFGNLVTTEWWNDIWLNEGFATFMGHYAFSAIHPEYEGLEYFQDKLEAMSLDQMVTAHPVSLPDEYVGRFNRVYDTITYTKGASLLIMIERYLGEDTFFKCLTKYLTKFEYSNTKNDDLWLLIEKETGDTNIYYTMIEWTKHEGFPLVSIAKDNGTIRIFQERMILTTDKHVKKNCSDSTWQIPIYYTTDSKLEKTHTMWLTGKEDVLKVTKHDKWVKINIRFIDFYRSNYDPVILSEITRSLRKDLHTFSIQDKMDLISDSCSMLSYGKQNISDVFNLFEFLRKENDYYVLSTFFDCLSYIAGMVSDDEDLDKKMRKYIQDFTLPIIQKYGWDHIEDYSIRQTQVLCIRVNTEIDHSQTVSKARDLFSKYLKNNISIDSDMLPVLACAYLKNSGEEAFDKIFGIYNSTFNPTEERMYLRAMGCFEDRDTLKKFLKMSLEDIIPVQDKLEVIMAISSHGVGVQLAREFVTHNYPLLNSVYANGMNPLPKIFKSVFGGLKTEKDLNRLMSFFSNYALSEDDNFVKITTESIKNNIYWLEKNREDLRAYFADNKEFYKFA